jgi:diguanylate cyclase (GGDEF)-like protein/PAS domain S-box-containing protein
MRELGHEGEEVLFVHCPDGVLLTDPDGGEILAANPAACWLLGQPEAAIRRRGPAGLGLEHQHLTGSFRGELSFVRGDGTTFPAAVTSALGPDAAGRPRAWLVLRDLSEKVAADAALHRSEQRFRSLVDNSGDAFIAMDAHGVVTDWNHQAEAMFGWSRAEVLGRRLADTVIPPRYRECHARGLARYLATGQATVLGQRVTLEGRRRDGVEFPIELTVWALDGGAEVSFNALVRNLTERSRLEAELWELALMDDLTGLHNRRSFILLAEQALKEAARARRPVIAVFADVDDLKTINDTYGHAEGDRVLQLVADALTRACRESDLVARLGGDEFVIILAETHGLDGLEGRIRRHLADLATALPYALSVSLGVAHCDATHPCRLEELLEQADRAMYRQKATSRQPGSAGGDESAPGH